MMLQTIGHERLSIMQTKGRLRMSDSFRGLKLPLESANDFGFLILHEAGECFRVTVPSQSEVRTFDETPWSFLKSSVVVNNYIESPWLIWVLVSE